jgi:hypothetical protein
MRRLFLSLGAALLLLTLPGCTKALIEEAETVKVRQHRVADVTQAWVTTDGNLTVCARGWLANSVHSVEPEEFHFAVPLERSGAPAAPPQDRPPNTVPASYVAAAYGSVARGCPEQPADAADVEIAVIPPDHPGRPGPGADDLSDAEWLGGGAGRKLWVLSDEVEPAAPDESAGLDLTRRPGDRNALEDTGPVVVRREELPDAAILYRHDEATFHGSRMAWINPGEGSGRQRGLYVFLPVTLLLDAPAILFLGLIGEDPF